MPQLYAWLLTVPCRNVQSVYVDRSASRISNIASLYSKVTVWLQLTRHCKSSWILLCPLQNVKDSQSRSASQDQLFKVYEKTYSGLSGLKYIGGYDIYLHTPTTYTCILPSNRYIADMHHMTPLTHDSLRKSGFCTIRLHLYIQSHTSYEKFSTVTHDLDSNHPWVTS